MDIKSSTVLIIENVFGVSYLLYLSLALFAISETNINSLSLYDVINIYYIINLRINW